MPGKKSLTIGITVNLENYENLRLEVTGEVTGQQEVSDLVGFLDETLATFGRGNATTADLIEKYRARVFSTGAGAASTSGPAMTYHEPEPEWPALETPVPSQQPLVQPDEAVPTPVAEPATPTEPTPIATAQPTQKKEIEKKQEQPPAPKGKTEPMAAPTAATPAESAPPTAKPKTKPAPVPVAAPAPSAAAPSQPTASGAACEICGCAVSSSEQKMSQLFMSRILCKTCMKKA